MNTTESTLSTPENVASFIQWNPEWVPGEVIRAPATYVMPNAGKFWHEPLLLVENNDERLPLATRPLTPWNEFATSHPVYAAKVGDTWLFHDDAEPERTIYFRLLGVYKPTSLIPNDWNTGMITFTPCVGDEVPEQWRH